MWVTANLTLHRTHLYVHERGMKVRYLYMFTKECWQQRISDEYNCVCVYLCQLLQDIQTLMEYLHVCILLTVKFASEDLTYEILL